MNDGQILLIVVAVISLLLILLPFLFSALKESGHLSRRKPSAFRRFPTFPTDGGEE